VNEKPADLVETIIMDWMLAGHQGDPALGVKKGLETDRTPAREEVLLAVAELLVVHGDAAAALGAVHHVNPKSLSNPTDAAVRTVIDVLPGVIVHELADPTEVSPH